MKITKRQLRRLIEASVRRDGEFVIPVEEPLSDPLEDLYYNEKQKKNIKMLAMTDDEEAQASAGEFAELGGFEPTDRFGADDFSKQVVAYELDIDILNDFKELDTVIKDACMNWMYHNKDEITVYDVIQIQPYEDYVKEVVEEPQDIDNIMLLTIQIITDEIDHLSQQDEPNGQLIERFKKAKKLFESNHEAVRSHVYDILTLHPHMLYKLYFDTNSEIESIGADFEDPRKKYAGSYPPHGATDKERYDMRMATFKEGKMKLTGKQLRSLINESLDYLSPEDKREADRKSTNLNRLLSGDSSEISPVAELALALGGDFSKTVRDAIKQSQAIDNLKTNNELAVIDEIIRMIGYRALSKFGLAKFNPQYGYFEISPELEEQQFHLLLNKSKEMVYGTKQNILNAIENAVVQTIVAFAEVAEED